MSEGNKLYPLKLPRDFHGQVKNHRSPTQIYAEKSVQRGQNYVSSNKVSNWKRKILDKDVISERKEFLVHPAKISSDNPDWLKSTYHHFNRNYASVGKKETLQEKKTFDVFGNKKYDPIRYQSQTEVAAHPGKIRPEVAPKIGFKSYHQEVYHPNKRSSKPEVTGKVGTLQVRNSLVRRPQLKIGSLHGNNFVDTYTVN